MPTIADSLLPVVPVGPAEPPVGPISLQYRHRTVSGVSDVDDNIMFPWYWTRLSHPALNNNPQAVVTVTPVGRIEVNEQTHVATLIQPTHPVGVLYRDLDSRWYIYNIGLEAMDLNVDFNVAINEESQPPG